MFGSTKMTNGGSISGNNGVPDKCGGFVIILYMLFHIRDVTKHSEFDKKSAQNLKNKCSEDQITRICDGLTWALNNRGYNFKRHFPGMRFNGNEKGEVLSIERVHESNFKK